LISSIQRIELFLLLRLVRRSSIISRLFDCTPHLGSISRLFWEYDYLLEASGFLGCQQPLAEVYSGKFKLKFVRILMTPIYCIWVINFKAAWRAYSFNFRECELKAKSFFVLKEALKFHAIHLVEPQEEEKNFNFFAIGLYNRL